MVWLIIGVVLLAAFGPLLWLMPSRRDRRLSALRTAARRAGLTVEMVMLPRLDVAPEERVNSGGRVQAPARTIAVYRYPLPRRLRHLPGWRIFRARNGLPALPGWVFAVAARPDHPRLRAAMDTLASAIDALPDGVLAVDCEAQQVGVYWQEPPGSDAASVVALAAWLVRVADALVGCDRGFDPPPDDEPGHVTI
ncbi:MAG: hypothetical protein ACKOBM_10705 [Gammaproteobacteria bacterium]